MNSNKKIVRRNTPSEKSHFDVGLSPLLQRVYAARGVVGHQQLDYALSKLQPFSVLKGIDTAVQLLAQALAEQQHIMIVADFDADGATSCTVAMRALRAMGAGKVSYLVPNRFEYGYGLTPEIVELAKQQQPDLIVTVDNGISSVDGVRAAKDSGIKVLVTDHHLPGKVIPDADAIVNPNQPGDEFPSKNLAGVGVIFYVMLALRAYLRESGWFEQRGIEQPNLATMLDIVALGTVADVVPLDHNNRILVSQGLARIRRGICCAGISALLNVGKRNPANIVASDLGFAVGPRLNAAGRLEDMSLGIECLLADDPDAAMLLAQRLDELNRERREIEGEMQAQALECLADIKLDIDDESAPIGLCLFDASWHQGVVGIVASRIKDRYHRPVIAFALAHPDIDSIDAEIKGSARSIKGIHMRDVLDAVATTHPGLLTKFGGHAMAAGMTLKASDFKAFEAAFNQALRCCVDDEILQDVIHSDGELEQDEFSLELAEALRAAGPWGQAFPEPVFDGDFEVVQQRIVGEKHLKLVLQPVGSGNTIDAIAFNHSEMVGDQLQAAFRLDVNEYMGRRTVQLMIEYIAD
ncbi:MAG: single-stranded-DNA-specific exonuclease RecJ [Thiotrichaceae bacterium]|nr:single-stranded-DNA-specific exonuclease RecJ [Thiotrichaceae bacterium]PCI15078.1 MAG: single-stranded-DNA-specific exonuclease RecJ [Thiotrichales bacterium]